MTELVSQVPGERVWAERFKTLALAGLQMVPLGGGAIAQVVGDALAQKSRKRDLEFFEILAARLNALNLTVEGWSAADAFDDDQFVAHSHRLVRAAQETANDEKRQMLAAALASSGSWSPLSEREVERFVDMVARYTPLHAMMVKYFENPIAWLSQHSTTWTGSGSYLAGSMGSVLQQHVFAGDDVYPAEVGRVCNELQGDGLIDLPGLSTMMTGQGITAPRIKPLGIKFLAFLGTA